MFLSGCELTDLCMSLLWRRRQELHHIKVLEAAAVRVLRDKLDKPKATGLLCLSKHHLSQLFAPLVEKILLNEELSTSFSQTKKIEIYKNCERNFHKDNIKWFPIIQMKEKWRTQDVLKKGRPFFSPKCAVFTQCDLFLTPSNNILLY